MTFLRVLKSFLKKMFAPGWHAAMMFGLCFTLTWVHALFGIIWIVEAVSTGDWSEPLIYINPAAAITCAVGARIWSKKVDEYEQL
jgi:hypothetical protein